MPDQCSNCRFFKDDAPSGSDFGYCHRCPPIIHASTHKDDWVVVGKDQWCGEYKVATP